MADMSREYKGGIAGSLASAHALASAMRGAGDRGTLGVGLGNFGGQTAISVGAAVQVSNSLSLTTSVSSANRQQAYGVGFSMRLF